MNIERGILLNPNDLSEIWMSRLRASNLRRFGLHPGGGKTAYLGLESMLRSYDRLLPRLDELEAAGITVEHEIHAVRWMLPTDMFDAHQDWFRMNANGERTADSNLCPSNGDALEFISNRAAELASRIPAKSHRYHLWADDVLHSHCFCPDCRRLSPSDQALMIANAILRGLRRVDAQARECYLAYYQTIPAPRLVEPEDGIYLEFAPMDRDYDRPLSDVSSAKNAEQIAALPDLFACFGPSDAIACDYWLDNALRSDWKRPPKPFTLNQSVTEADLSFYESCGFSAATTFSGCLGDDYEALYGPPSIEGYLSCTR